LEGIEPSGILRLALTRQGACLLRRFIVTGVAGFVGSHLSDHLLADGHEARLAGLVRGAAGRGC